MRGFSERARAPGRGPESATPRPGAPGAARAAAPGLAGHVPTSPRRSSATMPLQISGSQNLNTKPHKTKPHKTWSGPVFLVGGRRAPRPHVPASPRPRVPTSPPQIVLGCPRSSQVVPGRMQCIVCIAYDGGCIRRRMPLHPCGTHGGGEIYGGGGMRLNQGRGGARPKLSRGARRPRARCRPRGRRTAARRGVETFAGQRRQTESLSLRKSKASGREIEGFCRGGCRPKTFRAGRFVFLSPRRVSEAPLSEANR